MLWLRTLSLCGTLLLSGLVAAAAPQAREIASTLGRHYGHLIGEHLTHSVRVAAPAGYSLDRSTLPKPGRANRVLELRGLDVSERSVGDERHYDLQLRYQIMASDDVLTLASLPRPTLQFTRAAQRTKLRLSEQYISVSPLSEAEAWHRGGLEALRPDRGTPLLNTGATKQRLAAYGAALAALALYWLYRLYGLPFLARSRGPFHRAWRTMQAQRGDNAAMLSASLQSLHRAFDETFGASLFRHQVDNFLERYPRYAKLRQPIERFFEFSRRHFYAAQAPSDAQLPSEAQLVQLRELARHLHWAERQLQ